MFASYAVFTTTKMNASHKVLQNRTGSGTLHARGLQPVNFTELGAAQWRPLGNLKLYNKKNIQISNISDKKN